MLRSLLSVTLAVCALGILPAAPASAWDEPIWTKDGLIYPEGADIPAGLTKVERAYLEQHPLRPEYSRSDPPTGTIHCVAEYEPMEGLLIAWESYTSLLTDLTVGVTTGDPQATVYVVVDSSSEQNSAYGTLLSAGADMEQVEFIIRTTDTVWIRDYGPRYIFEDSVRAIIDHTYNRPRPNDNAFNDYLSYLWGEPEYDIPLTHGGGNFHLFANGDAFMSSLILDENPGLSEQDVKDLFRAYQNVDLTIYPRFPSYFDWTGHIDMWMLPVADDEIIIGEYASSAGQPYTISENAAADLISRGYTVYRTPGWNSGGTHYTYTNAVVLNNLVFVSEFGGPYAAQDAQALAVFQQAFPDHSVGPLYCGGIIHAAGAIHCVVMHVPTFATTLLVTPDDDLEAAGPAGGPFAPDSIVYTLRNTTDTPIDYSVTHTVPWLTITNASGVIPGYAMVEVTVSINEAANELGHGLHVDTVYFTNLTDHDGDTERRVSIDVDATALQYEFSMDSDPGWLAEGQWAFGQPTGGGSHNRDPSAGYTDDNVYGYNLYGDYANNMPAYHLTTAAIDCSDLIEVELRFWRWLGVESSEFDHASVAVSNDGTNWTELWSNPASPTSDSSWSQMIFDISAVADDQPTVYLRWTMGPTDSSNTYPGWNIDDVEIWAVDMAPPCFGDLDGDDDVDLSDLSQLLAHYGMTSGAQYEDGDLDADGDVDLADLAELLAVYGATCP
ncbi:MAG: agmatine deiminase family protein [Phycisphaerae bacterium]